MKKKMSGGKAAVLGATAAAIGATAYYFLGPKGKQHQRSSKKWVQDAKRRIIEEIEEKKEITQAVYEDIVENVVKLYAAKGATVAEVVAFTKTLKKDWRHIAKAAAAHAGKAARVAKSGIKKARSTVRKSSSPKKTK